MAHVRERDWLPHPEAHPPTRWIRVALVMLLLALLAAAVVAGARLMSL